MFEGILHFFLKRWCISSKAHLHRFSSKDAVITRTEKRMYHIYMKLNLKWCWNLSLEGSLFSLQSCMCWFFSKFNSFSSNRNCCVFFTWKAQSQARPSLWNTTFLENTTWIHRCWVIVVSALCCFSYFSYCGIF